MKNTNLEQNEHERTTAKGKKGNSYGTSSGKGKYKNTAHFYVRKMKFHQSLLT